MTTPVPTAADEAQARDLFMKLDHDIRDRQGIGDEWQAIDGEVMTGEIMPKWESIIARAIAAAREQASFVPGEWTCLECKFFLVKSFMSAETGDTWRNTEAAPENCPNCNVPMVKVKFIDALREARRDAEEQFKRAYAAEEKAKTFERDWFDAKHEFAGQVKAARAEGERAQLDRDIDEVCWLCSRGIEYVDGMHQDGDVWKNCQAIPLHRARRAHAAVQPESEETK